MKIIYFGFGLEIGHEISGQQAFLQFLTSYIIEESLSLDNIFVIAVIFSFFNVPLKYQHRVLFYGILGVLILRGIMITFGVIMIRRFDWMVYIFGLILLFTAVKILISRHDNLEPEKNFFFKLAKRIFPVTYEYHEEKFFVKIDGQWFITPLFLVLIVIESMDVLFAVDSIPACFAVTTDPFLVFTSNIFAILGLRSLYFALAGIMEKFRYLKMSLVFILAFVGIKMLLSHHYPVPTPFSLAVILGLLSIGIIASVLGARKDTAALISPIADEIEEITLVTWKQAKRIAVIILGISVLLIGIGMIILPGPAVLVIPAGLAILSVEFVWARVILKRIKEKIDDLSQFIKDKD